MRFKLETLQERGIEIEYDEVTGILDISGNLPVSEKLGEACQSMAAALTDLPALGQFEASQLVDTFMDNAIDTSLLNSLKACQES